MTQRTKIILGSVIGSLALVCISGFTGYKIALKNDTENKNDVENKNDIEYKDDNENKNDTENKNDIENKIDIEYINRKKKIIQIVGIGFFYSFDDLIYDKRRNELLLIKDNIYNINFNDGSKKNNNKEVTFFYNRGNEIYKYVISNFSYDTKEIIDFLINGSKNNKDILDVKKAIITKIKVE
ncbi:hypothetical protein [Mycoplasma capricolum]|uniref:Lipoprotein n=2 Tax=Mycoplasma capricolum subsp. capricolum TaxID=40479 RepID=A0A0C3A197_MYCCA|nr:hypothetical protein [Mycoplasma capricolum]KEZ18468.1 Hypothetical protein, predicted membrane protein [Mycoplasma capricolum subsp. capricolum 14232]KIM14049.1 lipoprotein [Mycoplasma capricolum subsp. capricolum]KKW61327.1 hypothetical protein AAK27_755 [Mycoplasma capricolum subsp. capricolum]